MGADAGDDQQTTVRRVADAVAPAVVRIGRGGGRGCGLVVGEDAVYVAAADGDVIALNRRDGTPLWTQAGLHRRGLSSPALDGSALVLADFEGYVHWLDAATGDFLGRTRSGDSRVTNAPLVVDDLVVVLTDGGSLNVFRRKDRAPRASG